MMNALTVRAFWRLYNLIDIDRADLRMLVNFLKMMVRERFLGSALGLVWAVANPVLMLGIFTFVFGFVFKSKLPGAETSLSYVIWLISGYGPWLAIAEGLNSSTNAVIGNASLVKNLKFKTELLPMAGGLTGLVPLLVGIAYLIALLAIDGRIPSAPWLIVPLYLVMQFAFVVGVGLMLAAANVFVRDVGMVLPNILIMLMFASPIFYPIRAFPAVAQKVMLFNPFYLLAEGFRQPLLYAAVPPLWQIGYLLVVTMATFGAGLFVFRRFKNYFDSEL